MSEYKHFNPSNDERVEGIKDAYTAFSEAIEKLSPPSVSKDKALVDALSASMFAVKACFGGVPKLDSKG